MPNYASSYLHSTRAIVPAKQRWLVHEQMEIVLGTDLAVPMVDGALETPGPFPAHLQSEIQAGLRMKSSSEQIVGKRFSSGERKRLLIKSTLLYKMKKKESPTLLLRSTFLKTQEGSTHLSPPPFIASPESTRAEGLSSSLGRSLARAIPFKQ